MPTAARIPAAQYLRMSTEHQRYSLKLQAAAIDAYAADRGYEIQRSYFDPGKSGLTFKERKGLQALLSDALSPTRAFDAVLVLDVSRWGRFQDPDQSAYYEFLCRDAGVQVVYCAEPFDNDGTMASGLVKQLKRLMAAEYSRELSAKVTLSRLQQARDGFYQGGGTHYGLRRIVVDGQGMAKATLGRGVRKAIASDRVIIAHGTSEELAVIRRIFKRFVKDSAPMTLIAAELNTDGVKVQDGHAWTSRRIRGVLTNELLIGDYVFNRTRRTLKTPRRPNPPQLWIRVPVMRPLISPKLFMAAKIKLGTRRRERLSRSQMLGGLRRLLRANGYLTTTMINEYRDIPHSDSYIKYFGSLSEACRLIGYARTKRWWRAKSGPPASDPEVLELLKRAYAQHGHLTSDIIEADPGLPSTMLYRCRFGSLINAYRLAGLPCEKRELAASAYARSVARGSARVCQSRAPTPERLDIHLAALRASYLRERKLTARSIKADKTLHSPDFYVRRFGSLGAAYALAGLSGPSSQVDRAMARADAGSAAESPLA